VKQLDNATGKREENWIIPTKGLLSKMTFLKDLQGYEKDKIEGKVIDKI